jgi:hypothetical protein
MSFDYMPVVTRSEDESGTRIFHAVEASLADALYELLRRAELSGFVITVDLLPCGPLAMGNYQMVGHVRRAL